MGLLFIPSLPASLTRCPECGKVSNNLFGLVRGLLTTEGEQGEGSPTARPASCQSGRREEMEKSLGGAGLGLLPAVDFWRRKVRGGFGEFQPTGELGCEGKDPCFSFVVWSGFDPGGAQSVHLASANPSSGGGSKAGGDPGFSGAIGRVCAGDLAGAGASGHSLRKFV